MQDLYDEAVYGCSTNKSSSNDGHIEHVWMRRLAPIITQYVCRALSNASFDYGSWRGDSHPFSSFREMEGDDA
jgi:hypothetical protein